MHQLSAIAKQTLALMNVYLDELSDDAYKTSLPLLSDASIGGHTRHLLDGFICIMRQQSSGKICYDDRERDCRIESEVLYAKSKLNEICRFLDSLQQNDEYTFEINYNGSVIKTYSTLERELIHNIEHVIHHLAIIKIALLHYHPEINIPKAFGVAPSTLKYWQSIEAVSKS